MNAKQRIVSIIRSEYEKAEQAHRMAFAERVGIDAASNAWDDFNKHNNLDGVGCRYDNPHTTQALAAIRREEAAKLHYLHMKDAYQCAVDTFLSEEPNK